MSRTLSDYQTELYPKLASWGEMEGVGEFTLKNWANREQFKYGLWGLAYLDREVQVWVNSLTQEVAFADSDDANFTFSLDKFVVINLGCGYVIELVPFEDHFRSSTEPETWVRVYRKNFPVIPFETGVYEVQQLGYTLANLLTETLLFGQLDIPSEEYNKTMQAYHMGQAATLVLKDVGRRN